MNAGIDRFRDHRSGKKGQCLQLILISMLLKGNMAAKWNNKRPKKYATKIAQIIIYPLQIFNHRK